MEISFGPGGETLVMLKSAWIAVLLLACAGLASAQIPSSGNIFFGYSFENTSSLAIGNSIRPNLQGWEGSLEGKLVPFVGLVTDFSGHYGTQNYTVLGPEQPINISLTGHEYEVLFGPRVSVPVGKFTPFGEFMVGVAHLSTTGAAFPTNTSFATALGGGLDYRLIRLIAVRVEGDYVATHFYSTTQNNLRVSTGIVFRF
jgi:opacity protein-like surface antigen